MNIQELQKTISNLEELLTNTTGSEYLELNRTIFKLQIKLSDLSTSPLEDLNINISQEDIDLLNQATVDVKSAIATEQRKTELITQAIGIGKKILGFI